MGEILQTWLRTRLGAIMDLTPEIFGHYTRDGRLLAQILHSYDIISRGQLDTIIRTQDPALCRVNLKYLRVWLRFLGIDCNDECTEEISCGKGTTALRLFYKVYLCLESKDRLHFITLQKEREKFVPTSKKFEVNTVSEEQPPYEPPEHPLARKLAEGKETIEWHSFKFRAILRACERERERFEAERRYPVVKPVEHHVIEAPEVADSRKEESEQLDNFARKHRVRDEKRQEDDRKTVLGESVHEDPSMAKAYVEWLKNRSKRAAIADAVKSKIQKTLLSSLSEKLAEKQESEFDEAVARRVLDQSRYEKQIMTRLSEVRNQKNIMAENQKILVDLVTEAREQELRQEQDREFERTCRNGQELESECHRMCELRRRIFEEKVRKLREKHHRLCLAAVADLVDIAVKAAEYRRANDGHVPQTVWSEWRALFLNCQAIFDDPEEDLQEQDEEEEEERSIEESESKLERTEVLREAAFQDYHEVNSPWDDFAPELDEKREESLALGSRVLGYVVHRLLEFLYPYPVDRTEPPVPRPKTTAVVVGIANPVVHETIGSLLEKSRIRVVRMEDAINHCLGRYKSEMTNVEYIDLNIVEATSVLVNMLQDCGNAVDGDSSRKKVASARSKKSEAATKSSRKTEQKGQLEKQTQTPRTIPYDDMDPVLSDAAYIGKWAYEFLALGEPISNELATKILVEYLKSLTDVEGWALIDYPNTYEQMARLETALTGRQVPQDPKILDFDDVNIEDIDPPSARIVFEAEDVDVFTLLRKSRLLPNPIVKDGDSTSTSSFLTIYIRAAIRSKNTESGNTSYELLSEIAPSIDKFYAARKIAYALHYSNLDLPTLKMLTRLVIGDPLHRKSSEEIFGEAAANLKREAERGKTDPKPPLLRRLVLEIEPEYAEDAEDAEDDGPVDVEIEAREAKPGERDWHWIDFPLPSALSETLAGLWENLERVYVEDLKELFFLKSVHHSSVVPYRDFVTRNAQAFVERPDEKQNLLHEFHRAFNAVDDDAREDVDVKCELHRRVADFQSRLWDICDRRKREADAERRRLIDDQWTLTEAMVLLNVYVGILQAEMDRCVDTVHLVQDYYTAMLRRPLQESAFAKSVLNRVEVDARQPINFQDQESSDKSADRKDRTKTKAATPKTVVPPAVDRSVLEREISELLRDAGNESFDPGESCVYAGILANVRYVRSVVDTISTAVNDALKREEAAVVKNESAKESVDSHGGKLAKRGRDLILEWRYAVNYELDRVRFRLDTLSAAGLADVNFLLDTMRRTFHRIYESIVDRYWREMKSVNEMTNVFCFAIEEARPIEKEMLLDGDQFIVRSNVLMMPEKPPGPSATVAEIVLPSQFRIAQLSRLMETLSRVAPHGTLVGRSLASILQDLSSHGEAEGEEMSLPCSWHELRPSEFSTFVDRLFGLQEYVDWRELIVYAMDLPMPSDRELLKARDRFRTQDPDLKEVVTRDQFHRTPLWFLRCTEAVPEVNEILYDAFHRNREELYEEELDFLSAERNGEPQNFIRKETPKGKRARDVISCAKIDDPNPEERTRAMLAKELLCRMYLTGRNTVNYTALLLAFCKDEDPRRGLGKALALAIGNRVCTDVREGEKYVEDLLEQRRLDKQTEQFQDSLRAEAVLAVEEALDRLLNKVERIILLSAKRRMRIESESQPPRLMILSLDEPIEIDPTILVDASSEHLVADAKESTGDEDENEEQIATVSSTLMLSESRQRLSSDDQQLLVYWIPRDVCLAVLAAALPWHAVQPELFESTNLREGVALAYEELRDETLSEEEDVVLAHRLVNHDFFVRLLNSTNKFTVKRTGRMVQEILEERKKPGTNN